MAQVLLKHLEPKIIRCHLFPTKVVRLVSLKGYNGDGQKVFIKTTCKESVLTSCGQPKYLKYQTGQPWETLLKLFLSILANWSQMVTIVYCYRCVSSTDAVAVVSWHTHAHTHSLTLCLSATLLSSPFFAFDIKTLSCILSASIEIQILTHPLVLISKVSSIRNTWLSIIRENKILPWSILINVILQIHSTDCHFFGCHSSDCHFWSFSFCSLSFYLLSSWWLSFLTIVILFPVILLTFILIMSFLLVILLIVIVLLSFW